MNRKSWAILLVTLALIGSTAGGLGFMAHRQALSPPGVKLGPIQIKDEAGTLVAETGVDLPASIEGYHSEQGTLSLQEVATLPKDTTFGRRIYKLADTNGLIMLRQWGIQVSTVLMGTDRTSIHNPAYCLAGQGWRVDQREFVDISVAQPKPYPLAVQKLMVSQEVKTADGRVVPLRGFYVYWFVGDGMLVAGEKERAWMTTWELLRTGKLKRWAYVSYFATCLPGQETATYDQLQRFIAESVPAFQLANGAVVASK